jgi:hypothetical protein
MDLFLLNPLSGEEGKSRVCKLEDICSNPSGQLLCHPRISGNQLIFLFSCSYKKSLITNNPAVLSSIILWLLFTTRLFSRILYNCFQVQYPAACYSILKRLECRPDISNISRKPQGLYLLVKGKGHHPDRNACRHRNRNIY